MATEIIINDGGAPARILPFIANATIAAGDYVGMEATGKVEPVNVSGAQGLGVALTAATSGNVANLVTGKGVILNTYCSGTIAAGAEVTMNALMYLEGATAAQKGLGQVVAIYIDSALTGGAGIAPSLQKVVFG